MGGGREGRAAAPPPLVARAAGRRARAKGGGADVRGDRSVEYGAATVRRHPHAARRAEILEEFPEVAELFGGNRWSAVWTAALVAFQLASAVWVTAACPVWVAAAASYCVGAVVDHALFVLSHDGTHNLILGTVTGNRVVMLLGNVPHVIPSAMFFHYYHKLHHSELKTLNDPEHPFPIEARVVGTSPLRKSVWLALFFVVQSVRTAFYTYRIPRRHDLAWVAVNFAVNAAANAAILRRFGVAPLVYLVASVAFSLGLHPLGARWIQEHYPTQPYQATYSYYGRANRFAFNVGHHVEHHDFSSVAWNRLPELRRIAAPYYDTLHSYSSYTRLLLDFIFDRRWSIGDRISVEQDYAGAVAAGAVDTTDPFSHRVRTGAQ